MDFIEQFISDACQNPAVIVFPESDDLSILNAVSRIKQLGIAVPILIGDETEINNLAAHEQIDLSGVTVVNNHIESKLDQYAELYRKNRPVKPGIARRLVKKPLSFGGMMVKSGDARGMVAGVANATASVIQAASLTIGFQAGISTPSSFFIMVLPDYNGKKDYPIIFADCAVNIDPSAQELAEIAVSSGTSARNLLDMEPQVALLSFATKGSANHTHVEKVRQAVRIAGNISPEMRLDGELQGDAALVPAVAAKKASDSDVAGTANVLVFPDLDSGNIAYKLVQYLGRAQAIGPILQGFARPVNDLSRGATVDDIIAVTAITSIQAQKAHPDS